MNFDQQTKALALPIGSLDAYISMANQIPMLTEEEEKTLTSKYSETNDLQAARRLVLSHLRFVVKIARGYSGYGLQQADLIQEGNVGLMKAVKRFDPTFGVRLVSFAVHWIKAEIHEFILKNWRIVKVATTKAQRKLFFNLRKAKKRLGWFSDKEIKEVADDLNVTTDNVREMEMRLNAHDAAFDTSPIEDSDYTPADYLSDEGHYDPQNMLANSDASNQSHQQLSKALVTLKDRDRDIIQQRWLTENKATLHDLAAKYQVSAERIRQIEANAFKKLKAAITTQ